MPCLGVLRYMSQFTYWEQWVLNTEILPGKGSLRVFPTGTCKVNWHQIIISGVAGLKVFFFQRGLQWIFEESRDDASGVIYFADDDNTYSQRLFSLIRWWSWIDVCKKSLGTHEGCPSFQLAWLASLACQALLSEQWSGRRSRWWTGGTTTGTTEGSSCWTWLASPSALPCTEIVLKARPSWCLQGGVERRTTSWRWWVLRWRNWRLSARRRCWFGTRRQQTVPCPETQASNTRVQMWLCYGHKFEIDGTLLVFQNNSVCSILYNWASFK